MAERDARDGRWATLRFAALLLATRLLFLFAALEPEEERANLVLDHARVAWERGPERPLYDVEELYAGSAADAIAHGVDAPYGTWRWMEYGGGSMVVAVVAAPLYAWFGPSYLVFKLVALAVTLLGGVAWFCVVRAWLGARAARWFGLLWIVAPPLFVRTALIAKGDHPEAMAWIGGVLLLATKAAHAERGGRRAAWAASAGVAVGLGLYGTYSTVPVVAGIGLAAMAITRLRPFAAWGAAAAGLAAGALPWSLTLAETKGGALDVYGRPLLELAGVGEIGARLLALVRSGFFADYELPLQPATAPLAAWIWLAAVATGWIVLARAWRRPAAALLLAGSAAHLAACCIAGPGASSRYLMPLYPLLLAAVAWPWAGEAAPTTVVPTVARGRLLLPLAVALMGAASQACVVARSSFVAWTTPLRGTHAALFGAVAGPRLSPAQIAAFAPSQRALLWRGVGRTLFATMPPERWARLAARAGPHADAVIEGIGWEWATSGAARDEAWAAVADDAATRAALLRGVARWAEAPFETVAPIDVAPIEAWLARVAPEERGAIELAAARALATLEVQGVDAASTRCVPFRAALPAAVRDRADGWALFRSLGGDGAIELRERPPNEWNPALVAGFADAWEWQLACLEPGWLLGFGETSWPLAKRLYQLAARHGDEVAAAFAAAAGRAIARVAVDLPAGYLSDMRLEEAIPAELRAAFAAGLASRASLPGPAG